MLLLLCTSVYSYNDTDAEPSIVVPLDLFPSHQKSKALLNNYNFEDGFEDDDQDKGKRRPFPMLFPDSIDGIQISFVLLESLLSELITRYYGWEDSDSHPELMDEGEGKRSTSRGSASSRQNSGRSGARTLLNYLFGCFSGGNGCCGGGGGDDHNEDNRRLLSGCQVSEIHTEVEADDEGGNKGEEDGSSPDSTPMTIAPSSACAVEAAQIEVDTDPPDSETSATPAESVYILIGHDVYRSQEGSQGYDLQPGEHQEVVYVFLKNLREYVPVLLTNRDNFLACPVCLSTVAQAVRLNCEQQHSLCQSCIFGLRENTCPTCRLTFESTEPNLETRRRIGDLTAECSWCQAQSTLSEIASHMKSCEQQPKSCAHCGGMIAPEVLDQHLQQCTKGLEDTSTLSKEDLARLTLQLARALSNAALPQSREQASQWVRFSNGTVLQPAPGSPGLLRLAGTSENSLEFYLRLDFSNITGNELGLDRTLLKTSRLLNSFYFNFEVRTSFNGWGNNVFIRFGFMGHHDQLPGEWILTAHDHEGKEVSREILSHLTLKKSKDSNEILVFEGWITKVNKASEELFCFKSDFWKKENDKRIIYYRLAFKRWQ